MDSEVFREKVVTYSASIHKIIGEVLFCNLGEQREESNLWNQGTRNQSFLTVRIVDSGPDWASQVQHNSKVTQLPSSGLVHLSVNCHMRRVWYLSHIAVRIQWNRTCNMCVFMGTWHAENHIIAILSLWQVSCPVTWIKFVSLSWVSAPSITILQKITICPYKLWRNLSLEAWEKSCFIILHSVCKS